VHNRKINKERLNKQYWISPEGKVHKYTGDMDSGVTSFHSWIANSLYPNSNRPTDVLFKLGWVMVGSTVYGNPICHKKPTNKQIRKLIKLDLFEFLLIQHNNLYMRYHEYENIICA